MTHQRERKSEQTSPSRGASTQVFHRRRRGHDGHPRRTSHWPRATQRPLDEARFLNIPGKQHNLQAFLLPPSLFEPTCSAAFPRVFPPPFRLEQTGFGGRKEAAASFASPAAGSARPVAGGGVAGGVVAPDLHWGLRPLGGEPAALFVGTSSRVIQELHKIYPGRGRNGKCKRKEREGGREGGKGYRWVVLVIVGRRTDT